MCFAAVGRWGAVSPPPPLLLLAVEVLGTIHKFTGKERDPESGLDNFGARYEASSASADS